MYTNPNDHQGNYNLVEAKPKKTNNNTGKYIALTLAIALLSGGSGYVGALLAGSENEIPTSSVSTKATKTEKETKAETTAEIINVVENSTTENVTTSSELTIPEIINIAKPSVVLIEASFPEANLLSSGTGFFITSDGYIVTNAHVIETEVPTSGYSNFGGLFGDFYNGSAQTEIIPASEVTITTDNDEEFTAEIVGRDTLSDLAVLKIEKDGLEAVNIGKSEELILGETTVTIGYPLGLGLSTSNGTITGLDREIYFENSGTDPSPLTLIQTNAAINSGNSGGPLLNNKGEVVGIISSKIASSEVDGVGFAIPMDQAMPLLEELMTTGEIANTTPKIGITGTDITTSIQRYYNLPVSEGIFVVDVEVGSAANRAGIESGDIIVGADGKECLCMDDLIKIKNKFKVGDTLTLSLARADGNIDVDLVLSSFDE